MEFCRVIKLMTENFTLVQGDNTVVEFTLPFTVSMFGGAF